MSNHHEFSHNMNQLVELLRKILADLPLNNQPGHQMPFSFKKNNQMNINFYFFNFLEVDPEDLEAYEEAYENFFHHDDTPKANFSDLDPSDIDFLKKNGIVF